MKKSIDDYKKYKKYKKYKRITVQPDELIIIDCSEGYEVCATTEDLVSITDCKQIKIECIR